MIPSIKSYLSPIFAGAVFFTAFNASADIAQGVPEMGDLERWAVFSLGSGSSTDFISASSRVTGDFGVAGNGNINLTGKGRINGDLYYRSNGTLQLSSQATITGARFDNQDALLDNDVNAAIAASDAAAGLPATDPTSEVNLGKRQNTTLAGAPGETVVVNLKNFQMSGSSTFTLQGTVTTTFIINVKSVFSLTGKAKIVLAGGVLWNDVLFNVRGIGLQACLSQRSQFQGILMATSRSVRVQNQSTLTGEIIANTVIVRNTGQVIRPPIVSP